jgi:multidrug efflux pump subunit AcrA (membrane-fusion protein)
VQRRNNDSHFVWTIADDSCAHRTQVAIGQTIGNRVVITNGLSSGQRVVTEGYQKLSEGTKVVF